MIINYLKTALRFLRQNRIFTTINITGLSIALAASFIILLFVINELSYDHCHKNRGKVFRVLNYYVDFDNFQAGTPYILATVLKEEFPQVERVARMRNMMIRLKLKEEFIPIFSVGTDSEVFDIFTLPLIEGTNDGHLLDNKNSVVLSRELAEMFFPGMKATGKEMVAMVNNKEEVFTVSAVFENIPVNSTLRARCLINSKWTVDHINITHSTNNADVNWNYDYWRTWILLSKDCQVADLEKQFRTLEIKYQGENPGYNYSLQSLSDVYLGSNEVLNTGIKGNKANVLLFSAIALIIVLVAAINYIILSTAVSSGRIKEIGIRKTTGAGSGAIKKQLLSESILLVLLVLPVALLLMRIALPFAERLFQTRLNIIHSNIFIYVIAYLVLTLLIGIASGTYTSVFLSRLKVMDVLKNTVQTGRKKLSLRSSLIVIQLVIFCTFVANTLVIRSQYQYALKKDQGYNMTNVLVVELDRDFKGYSAFINGIKSNPHVIKAAGVVDGLPMRGSMSSMIPHFQDKEVNVEVEGLAIDYNFLKTMGITLLEGRDFLEDFGTDLNQSVILNETAVKRLGITDPIGKKLMNQTIIGVVKDFNLHSIHKEIPPLTIYLTDRYIQQVAIHYKQGTLNDLLPALNAEWRKVAPDRPFVYSNIEQLIENLYSSEKNLSTIVAISAIFTLLIAAFGLFGLTLFVAKSRTKEIIIKKIFGSSEQLIVCSFLKNNLILVSISVLISIPFTIYLMTHWLNSFSYHTKIDWGVFAVAFIVALVVVFSTVLFHSYRASRINPVEALRYE